jgi:hypothetical protein
MLKRIGGSGFVLLSTIAAMAPSQEGCQGAQSGEEVDSGREAATAGDSAPDSDDATADDAGAADATAVDAGAANAATDASDAGPGDAPTDATVSIESGTDASALDSRAEADTGEDAQPLDAANDGAAVATDPISLSSTLITFEAACGSTPSARSFTIRNVSTMPVTWTANVSASYSVDVSGSTLAAASSLTVTVSPPPIPQDLTSLSTGGGTIIISYAAYGDTFSDLVVLVEQADGCIYSQLPTSIDFGDVPVGSTKQLTVHSGQYSCVGPNGGGVDWALGPVEATDPAFQIDQISHGVGDSWIVTFSPRAVGPHTEELTMERAAAASTCQAQSQVTFPATGTGVAVDAGAGTDAG